MEENNNYGIIKACIITVEIFFMSSNILFAQGIILDSVIFISFLFSLFNWRKIMSYREFRLFPIYQFFSLVSDGLCYENLNLGISVGHFPINLFIILEFCIFYYFFWHILNLRKNKN